MHKRFFTIAVEWILILTRMKAGNFQIAFLNRFSGRFGFEQKVRNTFAIFMGLFRYIKLRIENLASHGFAILSPNLIKL
jgi:hypothetical protein